jgi:hypothetical protein
VSFRRLLMLALPLLAVAPAPSPAAEPARQIHITVYGEDHCPEPQSEDEVVVCARQPEEERYRVPPALRERPDRPAETSWQARNEVLEEDARTMRPDSCSVVGSGGQSGCQAAFIRQWFNERRSRRTR